MLALGYSEKQMKAYFTENADTWQDVNLKKIEVYYFTKETSDHFFATRKVIDTAFTKDFIQTKITDTGIRQILLRHLEQYKNDAELAFSPDGIDEMNRNIRELNNGHNHQPIFSVRVYEKADKFTVGQTGNKSKKFVEAAKGTNLFFAVYESTVVDEKSGKTEKKRSFRTIPLNEAILKMKRGLPLDEQALFILSPNDLVYLPTEEERREGKTRMPLDKSRIYKMVSSNKFQAFFVNERVAAMIQDKFEYSPLNKMERAITGEMIKETCIPLNKQITITQGLLEALLENNCAVITCDSHCMPVGLMLPLCGNSIQSERFQDQISASLPLRKQLWQQTVKAKIDNPAKVLFHCTHAEIGCMQKWSNDVKSGDTDNM